MLTDFPPEVLEFFKEREGRSVVIKGAPGTGKTTFSLQILETLGADGRGVYLSTRVGDEALYSQFPWLKDAERRSKILDASKALLSVLRKETMPAEYIPDEKAEVAKEFLRTIHGHEIPREADRTHLRRMISKRSMPEIERVYSEVDAILPEKATIIVDSVEGITHKYGLSMEDFVFTLQKDLVENSYVNIIFVLEKDELQGIEYIVDGVISMHMRTVDGRRVREIHLEKLRATEIKYPVYLTSLKGGRFRTFLPVERENHMERKPWQTIGAKNGCYSTGIEDLDALLGGGFRKGSYVVIDIGEDVAHEEYWTFIRPMMLNFITNDIGILAVLTGGNTAEKMRRDLTRFVDEEVFYRNVRVLDYFAQEADKPHVLPLGAMERDESILYYQRALMDLRKGGSAPIMQFTGYDTVEYLRGGDIAIRDVFNAVGQIKVSDDIGLGVLKPGLKISREVINMADIYIKMVNVDKIPCIYGVKPKTILYAIEEDPVRGLPYIKLEPIV